MSNELVLPDMDHADGRFTLRDRAGVEHVLPGVEGVSVMEILRAADFDVPGLCGGAASCGTCHVYVEEAFLSKLPPRSGTESWQMEHFEKAQPNSRLACQIIWHKDLLDGLHLTLAPKE